MAVSSLVLFLILEEKLPVFCCWIWCKLWVLLCWYMFLYSHFFESFPHKSLLDFVQCFFCISWDDFYLSFFNVVCPLIDWGMVNYPCISGINPTWSWYITLLMYYWIQFANILVEIFAFYVHQQYGPVLFFTCGVLGWFWYQGNACLIRWTWNYSFLICFFGRLWERLVLTVLWIFGRIHL